MPEIDANKILDGVSLAIRGEYPDCQIEADSVEQGLSPPAFIILLLDSAQKQSMQRSEKRWRRSLRFDIIYFPKNKHGRSECYKIADSLSMILEQITLPGGDKIRGTDISYNIVDGVLHFNVTYKHFAVVENPSEGALEKVEIKQEVI